VHRPHVLDKLHCNELTVSDGASARLLVERFSAGLGLEKDDEEPDATLIDTATNVPAVRGARAALSARPPVRVSPADPSAARSTRSREDADAPSVVPTVGERGKQDPRSRPRASGLRGAQR
jgi:hypothetical protein